MSCVISLVQYTCTTGKTLLHIHDNMFTMYSSQPIIEALPGVLGNRGTRAIFSGDQRPKNKGNWGTQAILGNREHRKSKFCFWGTRPFFRGEQVPPLWGPHYSRVMWTIITVTFWLFIFYSKLYSWLDKNGYFLSVKPFPHSTIIGRKLYTLFYFLLLNLHFLFKFSIHMIHHIIFWKSTHFVPSLMFHF